MVSERHVHQFGGVFDFSGDGVVIDAGAVVAGGVVVEDYDACGLTH